MKLKWEAQPNPDYPGKGQRPWCIVGSDEVGKTWRLEKQFNVRHTAAREAVRIQVRFERQYNRFISLQD